MIPILLSQVGPLASRSDVFMCFSVFCEHSLCLHSTLGELLHFFWFGDIALMGIFKHFFCFIQTNLFWLNKGELNAGHVYACLQFYWIMPSGYPN